MGTSLITYLVSIFSYRSGSYVSYRMISDMTQLPGVSAAWSLACKKIHFFLLIGRVLGLALFMVSVSINKFKPHSDLEMTS